MPLPTIRLYAVGGDDPVARVLAQYYGENGALRYGRYIGRGPAPAWTALPEGEDVPDHAEHRKALGQGDVTDKAPVAASGEQADETPGDDAGATSGVATPTEPPAAPAPGDDAQTET
jgi:hypothetical protein